MTNTLVEAFRTMLSKHEGCRLLNFRASENIISPQQAWQHIVSMTAKPSIIFRDERLVKAQNKWWEIVHSCNLLIENNCCLISVGGLARLPWAQVQLSNKAPIFDLFAQDSGSPEFIVMDDKGNRFIGVTAEENEIWLYLVERTNNLLHTINLS